MDLQILKIWEPFMLASPEDLRKCLTTILDRAEHQKLKRGQWFVFSQTRPSYTTQELLTATPAVQSILWDQRPRDPAYSDHFSGLASGMVATSASY